MGGLLGRFMAGNDLDPHRIGRLREITAEELRDAIRLGTTVNHVDDSGALVEQSWDSDYSGAFTDVPVPSARIDADTLALVLRSYSGLSRSDTLDRPALQFDPRGLRLREVVIIVDTGTVPLHDLELPFPLAFDGCIFLGGDIGGFISVNRSVLPRLTFDTCLFRGGRASLLLDRTTITGELTFFQCEGLRQFFAPRAVIGEFRVHEDGLLLSPEQHQEFRTVLSGARIGRLHVEGEPHRIMPAGDCAGLQVDSVRIEPPAADRARGEGHAAARWLSGGTPPTLPLGSWGPRATVPHHRSAWNSLAAALSRADVESPARSGLRYIDQGTRLQLLADRHRDSKLGWFPRMLRWLSLDLTVRYFTANLRALGGLVGVWLVVAALAWINISELWRGSRASPAPAGPLESGGEGVLWALTYGLNFVVSPLDLGFSSVWPTGIWFLVVFALLKLLAITLFGLFIVGISGVVSRARAAR